MDISEIDLKSLLEVLKLLVQIIDCLGVGLCWGGLAGSMDLSRQEKNTQ